MAFGRYCFLKNLEKKASFLTCDIHVGRRAPFITEIPPLGLGKVNMHRDCGFRNKVCSILAALRCKTGSFLYKEERGVVRQ